MGSNLNSQQQASLPINGGCVVPCVVDVVTTTLDERGVGAMVDATVPESRKKLVIFVLLCQITKKPTPFKLKLLV